MIIPASTVNVVVAVIACGDKLLIARRPEHVHQGGKWEFPGGKQEPAESAVEALRRELQEELGITPTRFRRLISVCYQYPDKHVSLDVWLVTEFLGEAEGREGQCIKWIEKAELSSYTFPDANLPIVRAVRLPDCCVITPPVVPVQRVVEGWFRERLLIVRLPSLDFADYSRMAAAVVKSRRTGQSIILTSNMTEVRSLGADGLHLNRHQLMTATSLDDRDGKWISATCHNRSELEKANVLNLDFVLLSPLRRTATHPEADPLGWEQFTDLVRCAGVPVFALGGVGPDDLHRVWGAGAQGVAGIGAFWS